MLNKAGEKRSRHWARGASEMDGFNKCMAAIDKLNCDAKRLSTKIRNVRSNADWIATRGDVYQAAAVCLLAVLWMLVIFAWIVKL